MNSRTIYLHVAEWEPVYHHIHDFICHLHYSKPYFCKKRNSEPKHNPPFSVLSYVLLIRICKIIMWWLSELPWPSDYLKRKLQKCVCIYIITPWIKVCQNISLGSIQRQMRRKGSKGAEDWFSWIYKNIRKEE